MFKAILDAILSTDYLYLQLIPAVIGLVFIKKLDIQYKWFVLLLWYSVFNDVFALYYGRHIDVGRNKIIYNVYNIVYFAFLFWLFYLKFKKVILSIAMLFFVSIVFELFIERINYHNKSQVISYIVGSVGVLCCVFYYLISVLFSTDEVNVYKDLFFWIAIAHFFYYLGFSPLKIAENYFNEFFTDYRQSLNIKVAVTIIKSFILSFGFIWSRLKVQS